MIIDTNALSAFFDGAEGSVHQFERAEALTLPVVVLGEYRFGLRGSRERKVREAKLIEFAQTCAICPVLESTSCFYAKIKHQLKKDGSPIPENDIWIAAVALELGQVILSNDRHFDFVKGIERQGW